jgi:hypothetical protein
MLDSLISRTKLLHSWAGIMSSRHLVNLPWLKNKNLWKSNPRIKNQLKSKPSKNNPLPL